jgi:hypothetical protein
MIRRKEHKETQKRWYDKKYSLRLFALLVANPG